MKLVERPTPGQMSRARAIVGSRADLVAKVEAFGVDPDNPDPAGRIEFFAWPKPRHAYVLGVDFCFGVAGRDYDCIVGLDCSTKPVEQVFEAHGRWGTEHLDAVIYAAGRAFNDAYVVGESNGPGLPVLRRLLDVYGYTQLYADRDESTHHRRLRDRLGYTRTADNVTLTNLRRALQHRELVLRSEALIDHLAACEWFHPRDDIDAGVIQGDAGLKIRCRTSKSPDMLRALEYAWHGVLERPASATGPAREWHGDAADRKILKKMGLLA